jgi:glycoside/pentoside/hexuronide:cation symporter, GPH family
MKKLSFKEKFGYSLGEIGGTISWQGMMFYLGFFYTDIFGLTAQAAALLLFFPRFFDAFVDPIVGTIADRTDTRWGKFRPFILWMIIPYSVCMVLLYTTPDLGHTGKFIYAFATYFFMMIAYSFMMTPYNALGGVMTDDHIDRTSLQSFRFMMAFIGGLIVRGLTNPLVKFFCGYDPSVTKATNFTIQHSLQRGFFWTMLVFAVLSVVAFGITFFSTKEKVKPISTQKTSLKQDLKDLTHNGPWIILFLVSTLNLIYVGIFSTAIAYYFKYYVTARSLILFGHNTGYDMMSTFNVFGSIVIILVLVSPLTKIMAAKLGKRNSLVLCFSLVTLSIAGFYICKPQSVLLILFFQFIQSAAAAPTMPIVWSMYADAADYSEWKNNRRATGLVFSAVVLGQKAGIALGAAIPLWILGTYAYNSASAVQPATIVNGVKWSMSLIPAFVALLTTIGCLFYKLSNKEMDQIQTELAERRKQG